MDYLHLVPTGLLVDRKSRTRVRPARSLANIAAGSVRKNRRTTIHHRSQQLQIPYTIMHRIWHKDLGLIPYKVQLEQELKAANLPAP